MTFDWYVAKLKPGKETLAQRCLHDLCIEVYTPRISVYKPGGARWEALFPTYIFCRLAIGRPEYWPQALWVPGIQYFVGSRFNPTPAGQDLVDQIRYRVERWNSGGDTHIFQPKEKVIISGKFKDLNAVFQQYLRGRERCRVLLSIMGPGATVDVPLTDIEPLYGRRFALR